MTQGYALEFQASGLVTDADGNPINDEQEDDR